MGFTSYTRPSATQRTLISSRHPHLTPDNEENITNVGYLEGNRLPQPTWDNREDTGSDYEAGLHSSDDVEDDYGSVNMDTSSDVFAEPIEDFTLPPKPEMWPVEANETRYEPYGHAVRGFPIADGTFTSSSPAIVYQSWNWPHYEPAYEHELIGYGSQLYPTLDVAEVYYPVVGRYCQVCLPPTLPSTMMDSEATLNIPQDIRVGPTQYTSEVSHSSEPAPNTIPMPIPDPVTVARSEFVPYVVTSEGNTVFHEVTAASPHADEDLDRNAI